MLGSCRQQDILLGVRFEIIISIRPYKISVDSLTLHYYVLASSSFHLWWGMSERLYTQLLVGFRDSYEYVKEEVRQNHFPDRICIKLRRNSHFLQLGLEELRAGEIENSYSKNSMEILRMHWYSASNDEKPNTYCKTGEFFFFTLSWCIISTVGVTAHSRALASAGLRSDM